MLDLQKKKDAEPSPLYIKELFPYYSQLDAVKKDTILIRFNEEILLDSNTNVEVQGEESGAAIVKKLSVDDRTLQIITTQAFGEDGEKIMVKIPAGAVKSKSSSSENGAFTWSFVLYEEMPSLISPVNMVKNNLHVNYDRIAETLLISGLQGKSGTIDIFSVFGSLIIQAKAVEQEVISLPVSLPQGIYIVRFKGMQGEESRKFMVY